MLSRLELLKKRLHGLVKTLGCISLRTEDAAYKRQFIREYKSGLYKRHTLDQYVNCAYCTNLIRSNCHKHCLKCRAGSYVHCSPLLPGILFDDNIYPDSPDSRTAPWLYKSPCSNFNRLGRKSYFRNFITYFSWITIYNFEVLEGLLRGLSLNEKPCFICASVDYEIYRNCFDRVDFDKYTPCTRITAEIESRYGPAAKLNKGVS